MIETIEPLRIHVSVAAFLVVLALRWLLLLAAVWGPTRRLIRPLALVGIVCGVITVLNGLYAAFSWDIAAEAESAFKPANDRGMSGSRTVGGILYVLWPYVAMLIGGVAVLLNGYTFRTGELPDDVDDRAR